MRQPACSEIAMRVMAGVSVGFERSAVLGVVTGVLTAGPGVRALCCVQCAGKGGIEDAGIGPGSCILPMIRRESGVALILKTGGEKNSANDQVNSDTWATVRTYSDSPGLRRVP